MKVFTSVVIHGQFQRIKLLGNNLFQDYDPDIVCLQEATAEKKKKFSIETKYKYFSSRGGCAIYSKTPIRSM